MIEKDNLSKGMAVNVEWIEGDMFEHDFTGIVKDIHGEYVIVEDGDGDCWDCEPSQLSLNTDDIMHSRCHICGGPNH
jgi:hypothetical protein